MCVFLQRLPDKLVLVILSFLQDEKDICTSALVCRRWSVLLILLDDFCCLSLLVDPCQLLIYFVLLYSSMYVLCDFPQCDTSRWRNLSSSGKLWRSLCSTKYGCKVTIKFLLLHGNSLTCALRLCLWISVPQAHKAGISVPWKTHFVTIRQFAGPCNKKYVPCIDHARTLRYCSS